MIPLLTNMRHGTGMELQLVKTPTQLHPWWVKRLSDKVQWLMGEWEETRVARKE